MFSYQIDQHVSLRRIAISDAEPLFKLVHKNRTALAQWLPWANKLQALTDEQAFIRNTEANVLAGQELVFTILVDQQVAGLIELHEISQLNHSAGIGYWLGAEFQHQGVVGKALQQLTKIGFSELNLHRLEIIAAVENQASRAVAEAGQYQDEGTLREALALLDGFHDVISYSRLATD